MDDRVQSKRKPGTWLIAHCGPNSYIGRVHMLDNTDPYRIPVTSTGTETPERGEIPAQDVLYANILSLMPAYDFFAPLQRVPILSKDGKPQQDPNTGGLATRAAREPIVATYGFALKPAILHIPGVRHGTQLVIFSQMDETDRANYMEYVRAANRAAEESAARTAGIVMPSPTERAAIGRTHGRS